MVQQQKVRQWMLGILILMVILVPGIVSAGITIATFNQGTGSLSVDGKVIYRHEFYNWFEAPDQPNDNNDYSYFFTRSLLGLSLTLPNLKAYVQGQDVHMWGLPDDAVAAAPAGTLGPGAVYYAHGGQEDFHSTIIRQAYLEIPRLFVSGLSARAGRFDYVDGLEVTYDDPKVKWLKEMRLAERLIGPFTWSSFNRSFDGAKVVFDHDVFNLTGFASHPTQGGFENDAHESMEDIDLAAVTLTMKYNKNLCLPNSEGRLFYMYYGDDRTMAKVDNAPAGSGPNQGDIEIHTIGMHWLATHKTSSGVLDGIFWGAYQTGDWGTLDHEAWAAAAEMGYQFTQYPWTPWIRAGYFVSSGDPDPSDGDHETFYQMLPTARKYALFPFFNLMNNEDLFVQAIFKPLQQLSVRSDLHFLRLHEDDDRWYQGAGATREEDIFGYQGRPSNGDENLGTLLDITLNYTINKHFSVMLYGGHMFGSDVIENSYDDEDASMGYVEVTFAF